MKKFYKEDRRTRETKGTSYTYSTRNQISEKSIEDDESSRGSNEEMALGAIFIV